MEMNMLSGILRNKPSERLAVCLTYSTHEGTAGMTFTAPEDALQVAAGQ